MNVSKNRDFISYKNEFYKRINKIITFCQRYSKLLGDTEYLF